MIDIHPMTCDTAETFMSPGHQQETAVMVALSARVKLGRNTDSIRMLFETQHLVKQTLGSCNLELCSFIQFDS